MPTGKLPIEPGRLYVKPFDRADPTDEPVTLHGMHPAIIAWWLDATAALAELGHYSLATSANDEEHRQGSLHYRGEALDLRSNHILGTELDEALAALVLVGQRHRVRVILENRRPKGGEHFHAELREDLFR